MADSIESVRGKRVVIRFEATKCIHSRTCVLTRPDVFVPNVDGEWIHPDAASPEVVAWVARACPSGAIHYERIDGGIHEGASVVNLLHVPENGALAAHADILIDGKSAGLRGAVSLRRLEGQAFLRHESRHCGI